MFDVIVVGARCAGSPTAMLLARAGLRVLAVDRARFPSDTVSSHYLQPQALDALQRWGLLDRLLATGCPPIRDGRLDFGDFALEGPVPRVPGIDHTLSSRRTYLDALLVDAAREAGAEVREGVTLRDVVGDEGRVAGVRLEGHGGEYEERAPLVVGADGLHSRLARLVGAEVVEDRGRLACWYYTYFSGVEHADFELYAAPRRGAAVNPTQDGLTIANFGWPRTELAERRGDLEASFWEVMALFGLEERFRAARREEPFRGMADVPNRYLRSHGPGWVLIGDAGYYRDPCTALGISDAFRDAEAVTAAVLAAASGERAIDDALASYEEERNRVTRPHFRFTIGVAALRDLDPVARGVLSGFRDHPDLVDGYFRVFAGLLPARELFTPENVSRAAASPSALPALA